MNRLEYFQTFNEALGVAEPTQFYINKLTYLSISEFYKYVDATRDLGTDVSHSESIDVRLGYRQLASLIPKYKKSEYDSFPLSEILITFDFKKNGENNIGNSGYMIGGYASPFAKGREKQATRFKDAIRQNVNHTLSIHLGIEMVYDSSFRKISMSFNQFENTHLFKKVESVISHELNHLYEYYNRKIYGRKQINTSLTWASIGENVYGVQKELFDFWQSDFTEFIYCSENHEMNAQVQEAKTFVDRYDFSKFRRTPAWKSAKKMQSWTYEEFKTDFNKKALDNALDPQETLEKMKNIFCEEYLKLTNELKEEPSLDPEYLNNLSLDKFYLFFEKRFKESGTKLIKNYCRLFALKELEKSHGGVEGRKIT
jgi:hypothetical protein